MNPYVLCAAAYLAGSIPFGALLARLKGIDLRQVGSGNIGATNVARAMGKGWAVAVLAADACKGFVPVWLGRHFGLSATVIALAGAAAIIGHMFTLFLRGRGGKGVATSLGVTLVRDLLREDPVLADPVVYTRIRALGEGAHVGSAGAERIAERLTDATSAYVVIEGSGAVGAQKVLRGAFGLPSEGAEEDEDHALDDEGGDDDEEDSLE